MKKMILILLLALLGLFLLYVGINRIDAKADPGWFAERDLAAADFSYENGFYRLWTLGLDEGVDAEAPQTKERFRRLFDPQYDNAKEIAAFDTRQYKAETNLNEKLSALRSGVFKKIIEISVVPPEPMERLLEQRDEFLRFKEKHPVLIARYQRFLGSTHYRDFTAFQLASPIPNLLTWLSLARFHVGASLVDASEGRWNEAAGALIAQIDLAKRVVAGSRMLITNLVGKAVLNQSAEVLAFLMNQRECPAAVFAQVLAAMPPLRYEEYGSRAGIVGEFLMFRNTLDQVGTGVAMREMVGPKGFFWGLDFQRNRTLNEYHGYLQACLKMEASPLEGNPEALLTTPERAQGAFWWLRNRMGKIFLDIAVPNFGTVAYKALRTRSIYELTRISAELHLRYDPAKPVQDNLDALASYRQALDPCSGKPYIWNEGKQVLYGVGLDRVDGGGTYERDTWRTDVVLPVILYLKAAQAAAPCLQADQIRGLEGEGSRQRLQRPKALLAQALKR